MKMCLKWANSQLNMLLLFKHVCCWLKLLLMMMILTLSWLMSLWQCLMIFLMLLLRLLLNMYMSRFLCWWHHSTGLRSALVLRCSHAGHWSLSYNGARLVSTDTAQLSLLILHTGLHWPVTTLLSVYWSRHHLTQCAVITGELDWPGQQWSTLRENILHWPQQARMMLTLVRIMMITMLTLASINRSIISLKHYNTVTSSWMTLITWNMIKTAQELIISQTMSYLIHQMRLINDQCSSSLLCTNTSMKSVNSFMNDVSERQHEAAGVSHASVDSWIFNPQIYIQH